MQSYASIGNAADRHWREREKIHPSKPLPDSVRRAVDPASVSEEQRPQPKTAGSETACTRSMGAIRSLIDAPIPNSLAATSALFYGRRHRSQEHLVGSRLPIGFF